MAKYQKEHYEDVAGILSEAKRIETDIGRLLPSEGYADEFADLFATDNPKRCSFHGDHNTGYSGDCKITGFDREQFLEACGIKS